MENSEPCSDNDSIALSAAYLIGGANQPIQLYEGVLEVTQEEVTEQGSGNLSFVWLPYPHFDFYLLLQHNELSQDIRGRCSLRLPTFDVVAEVEILEIFYEVDEYDILTKISGRLLESIVIEPSQEISYVLFHLTNFKMFLGSWISSPDSETPCHWKGRVILEAEGWKVTIDALKEINDLVHSLHSLSGYAVTHVGKLERSNGEEFTAKEASDFLEALFYFLSFTRGLWSELILPVGYNASGNPIWREWNPHRVRVDRWQDEEQEVYSWFWIDGSHSLVEIFPSFMRKWRDRDWRESLESVIHWYVESNKQVGGVKGSIVLATAALELLSWVTLVDKGSVSKEDFKNQNNKKYGSTSNKINRLIEELSIEQNMQKIRESQKNLAEFDRKFLGNNNGLYAFTEVRNSITHATPENRTRLRNMPDATLIEAWELGLWYVELILLRLFEYQGVYVNRMLRRRLIGGIETVPWASTDS